MAGCDVSNVYGLRKHAGSGIPEASRHCLHVRLCPAASHQMSNKRSRSVANRNLRAVIDEQLTVAAHEIFRLLRERAQADVEQLKQLVTERVTAAVHIIFTVFETSRGADGGAEEAAGGAEEPGKSPAAPEAQLTLRWLKPDRALTVSCVLCRVVSVTRRPESPWRQSPEGGRAAGGTWARNLLQTTEDFRGGPPGVSQRPVRRGRRHGGVASLLQGVRKVLRQERLSDETRGETHEGGRVRVWSVR